MVRTVETHSVESIYAVVLDRQAERNNVRHDGALHVPPSIVRRGGERELTQRCEKGMTGDER